jgi:TRC40/GET3/ArsA family transport-energizing ATPase
MAQLIMFTGKGGVGKSTTSAATARHFAGQGYRTILVSSDPAHSTQDVLGVQVGFEPTLITENLWAKNLNSQTQAKQFFDELSGAMEKSFNKAVPFLDTEIFSDWANFPGMDEVFALEEIQSLTQGIDYDIVVFDTAPTGHTLKALTAPEALNSLLLRVLRMKAKIERMKSFLLKPSDTSKIVKIVESMTARLECVKRLLRDDKFVSINLVSIPTEAALEEARRTIHFLKAQGFKVKNLVINGMIPNFGSEVWDAATDNKAVALLKMEYELQQPYLAQFKTMTNQESICLAGVSRLPFEPKGSRLGDFGRILWGSGNIDFEPTFSSELEVDEDKGVSKLKLRFPYLDDVVLEDDGYMVDGFMKQDLFNRYPELSTMKVKRKQKTKSGATYTFE